jgi:tRNA threonylcarbamoyladenosine biosynthesis protein TsaE
MLASNDTFRLRKIHRNLRQSGLTLPTLADPRYYTENMDNLKTWVKVTNDLKHSLDLGKSVGSKLEGGEIIELLGDMGSGKTTFVKGIAAGAGSNELVHSPSFTISNEYKAKDLTIYHFDFHRLNDPGLMRQELAEILAGPSSITIIEWAGIVKDVLPGNHLSVSITPLSQEGREFKFTYPGQMSRLIPSNN